MSPRLRRFLMLGLLGAALFGGMALASPSQAEAQSYIQRPFRGERPFQLDVHGGFAWHGFGFAGGVRFNVPLIHNGFISSINNSFYLSFGADAYFVCYRRCGHNDNRYGPGLGFPITVHWEFYFSEVFSLFAEVGANVYFHPGFFDDGDGRFFDGNGGAWFIGAIGGRIAFSRSFGLVFRIGNPYSSFGITFGF
jgi:hypothetical protein